MNIDRPHMFDHGWLRFCLKQSQAIDSLRLNEHGFNDDSIATFMCVLPTLARCSALVHVNLADNAIGDVGMSQLADALEVR
jgi:hypothetical protein